MIDTTSFIIQICDCNVFIILLKLLHRILLGNVPKKLHKTLLRNPQLLDFFSDFLIIFLTKIKFRIRIMFEQQWIISRIKRRFPIADRVQFLQYRLLKTQKRIIKSKPAKLFQQRILWIVSVSFIKI
ncbi:hypothetical protein D3C72_1706150 [compost metagenome]